MTWFWLEHALLDGGSVRSGVLVSTDAAATWEPRGSVEQAPQAVTARTLRRRLSSINGFFAYLHACGHLATNPVPRGLATRRERDRGTRLAPLIRTPRTLPTILDPDEVDALTAALRTVRTHLVRVRRLARDNPDRLAASVGEHRVIAAAIAAGDTDLAAHATHVHLHNALTSILESLEASA